MTTVSDMPRWGGGGLREGIDILGLRIIGVAFERICFIGSAAPGVGVYSPATNVSQ